jgi:hypothetical protein
MEFCIIDLYVTIISSFEFRENCCREVRALRKGVREVLLVFSKHSVLGQNSVQETSIQTSQGFYEFHETVILYLGAYMNLYPYFPLFFARFWAKIGVGYLHVVLLIS